MALWETRVTAYRFALCLSYLVFLLYGLAFSIPMWLGKGKAIIGLWAAGAGDSNEIDRLDGTGFNEGPIDRDWFEAVRGLWAAGMALYLFAVIGSMVENCCMSAYSKDYGVSAFLLLLAGLSGGAGIIITAIKIEDDDYAGASTIQYDYMWGYMIAVIASGLAILCSIVLLITKNSYKEHDENIKNSRTADYVYAHKHHQRPYAPEYNNPTFRGDDGYPNQPAVLQQHNHTPYNQSPYNMYRNDNGLAHNNGLVHNKYEQGSGYHPYGYKDHSRQPGNRISMAESADLSNGYTVDIVNAEHNSLGRRGEFVGGSRNPQQANGDYFYSGNRPY